MSTPAPVSVEAFAAHLEARARAAVNLTELGFSIANDVHAVLNFRQALVFDARDQVMTVSGLVKLAEDSPYTLWLKRAWPWVVGQLPEAGKHGGWLAPTPAQLAAAPEDVADGWAEWWPAGVLALPLRRRDGELLGWAAFLLDQPPAEELIHLLGRLGESWSYCWEMLSGTPRRGLRARWQAAGQWQRRIALTVLLALCFLPVRQSALAPAEVVAEDAMAITAAIDGVIKNIHVRPNQLVKAGEPLFSLDDTTLRNRLEVTRKSVAVADAELQAATQMAFDDSRSKSELAALTGRAQEKRAELAAVEAQLARVDALAPYDGIAVFADPDNWQGRPVVTGERIMLLANPAKPALLVHLPVADAISLEVGSPLKFFLTVRPLSPVSGVITETSYQASVEGDGVASYRLRASLAEKDVRIGLRGTAKVYGGWVTLGYYILRRPLAKLREWSGW